MHSPLLLHSTMVGHLMERPPFILPKFRQRVTGGTSSTSLTNFDTRIYTVGAGDEWGALVVVHFTVSELLIYTFFVTLLKRLVWLNKIDTLDFFFSRFNARLMLELLQHIHKEEQIYQYILC
jgi:hypothetical protein